MSCRYAPFFSLMHFKSSNKIILLLSTMGDLAACLPKMNRPLPCRFIARCPSPARLCQCTLLRASSKPHKRHSLFIRPSFDPPKFLLHGSMHLLPHQVSTKLLLRLKPEWLCQSIRLLVFRAQVFKSNNPILVVVDQIIDTTREMLGTPVSACLLGRQCDHRLIVFADVAKSDLAVCVRRNPSGPFPKSSGYAKELNLYRLRGWVGID